MNLIVYLSGTKEINNQLLQVISRAAPDALLDVYFTIDELTNRLRQPFLNVGLAVLYAATRADLMELIFLEKVLGELRLVLILPDRDPSTVAKAHELRPRFLALVENDFGELESVLKRMAELYGRPAGR